MKYVNKLTDNELKNILISLAKDYYGMNNLDGDCCISRNDSSIIIGGYFNPIIANDVKCSAPLNLELDDFCVYIVNKDTVVNWTMTLCYRKRMFSEYGNQYILDAYWNDYIMMRLNYDNEVC